MSKKLYKINGTTGFDVLCQAGIAKPNRITSGFLTDNQGSILTEEQASAAWLLATVKYTKNFKGNISGALNKGFQMNVPWVAKRCNSVEVYKLA